MTYRTWLHQELERRKRINSSFSLRAFARQIRLSPGFLSGVLKGSKSLSPERAKEVAQTLGLSSEQIQAFSRSAVTPLGQTEPSERSELSFDSFDLMADWYHFAILELTYTRGFSSSAEWIGRRLGVKTEDAKNGVRRLLRMGRLEKHPDGALAKVEKHIATPSDIPSAALRSHHRQMISKASNALDSQPVDQRDITGITFAIHPSQVATAKEEIRNFRRRLADLLTSTDQTPESVYQLNVQFFELTESTENMPPTKENKNETNH